MPPGTARLLNIVESHEPRLLGSTGTVRANRGLADGAETCLMVYADNLSDVDLRLLLDFHGEHGDGLTMMLLRAPNPERCGIAELDAEGRVVDFVENPERPRGDLANAGLYALTPSAYREVADLDAFDIGYHVLPWFAGRMRGWSWGGYHRDVGTPEALERASIDAARLTQVGMPP